MLARVSFLYEKRRFDPFIDGDREKGWISMLMQIAPAFQVQEELRRLREFRATEAASAREKHPDVMRFCIRRPDEPDVRAGASDDTSFLFFRSHAQCGPCPWPLKICSECY